jgi:hypothetical protein
MKFINFLIVLIFLFYLVHSFSIKRKLGKTFRLKNPKNLFPTIKNDYNGCSCTTQGNPDCSCCVDLKIKQFNFDDEACLNITVIENTLSLSLTFQVGEHIFLNRTVSIKDPNICFPVGIPNADLCLSFTNMNYSLSSVSGCVHLIATLMGESLLNVSIACFKIPI